jgi:hypothetical protein
MIKSKESSFVNGFALAVSNSLAIAYCARVLLFSAALTWRKYGCACIKASKLEQEAFHVETMNQRSKRELYLYGQINT